ncbi:MAG: hypothetical protein ACYS17_15525 [Planctomycetota bacterium]|jgi:hypothetical protein
MAHMHLPNSQLVPIECKHGLWRGHGALLWNSTTDVGLLIVGAPKAGKSNVAYRIAKQPEWKLITGDHLEWALAPPSNALIGGLRISKTPEVFWWRDAQGNHLQDPELSDSLEWARVDQVVSLVRIDGAELVVEHGITPRTHLDVLKGSFFKSLRSIVKPKREAERVNRRLLLGRLLKDGRGRSCSWRSLDSALSVSKVLRSKVLTISMPQELTSAVFDKCADLIIDRLPVAPEVESHVAQRIADLSEVWKQVYSSRRNSA